MNREQIVMEIKRLRAARLNSDSYKLKKDYGKCIRRLENEIRYYDMHFAGGQNNG